MQQYYYACGGRTFGPCTLAQLQDKVRAGQLGPDDLVAPDGSTAWVRARTIPGLFAAPAVLRATPAAAPIRPGAPLRAVAAARPVAAPAPVADEPAARPGCAALLLALPKPILFALCGGLGGLLGAILLGEIVWAVLSPARSAPPSRAYAWRSQACCGSTRATPIGC